MTQFEPSMANALFLPFLTPKEAAPFTSSCKVLYKEKVNAQYMHIGKFAKYWAAEYEKLLFSVEYSTKSVARCLAIHYPPSALTIAEGHLLS